MKAQEYAGIALICGAIAFFFFLSEGLSTPSGYYFLDQEFEYCSSLPMDCIKEALVNCSPMRNGGGDPYLDLRFYVHPYNDSDCVVHQNLEMQWVDGTISLSADCLVRSGNYTDEEFTAVMEDAWSSSCNGSLVELYPAGQNPIEITIQKPREGDSYLKGDSVLMDIMVKGNKTHLLEDLTFMVDAGEGWVRADTTDIITIDLFSVDMQKTVFYQGTWNTSRIPVTEDADIRLRADALFRKDDDAIVTFSEAVTVRLNTSSLIPAGGDRFEPDNTFSDPGDAAKEIVPGEPYQNRSFHVPNDVDYIYFEGMGKRMFIVSWWTGTSTVKAGLTLYDSQRRLVAEGVNVDGQLQAVHGLREDERIYIKVESLGAAGKYNIIVTQLTDGDGDGFTIGLGPESDCDDTDPVKRPIRSGMRISHDIQICPGPYLNMHSPLVIENSNVIVDCNNQKISGTRLNQFLIINNSGRVVIKNCDISNFTRAIVIDNCDYCEIRNVSIHGNRIGIHAMDSAVHIYGSAVRNSDQTGIILQGSGGNIRNTTVSDNRFDGITLLSADSVVVSDSSFVRNKRNGMTVLSGNSIRIEGTVMSYNDLAGLHVNESQDILIEKSSFSVNSEGIAARKVTGLNITSSDFSSNKDDDVLLASGSAGAVMRYNSFLTPNSIAVRNVQPDYADAAFNFWNTQEEDDIRGRIIDYYDNRDHGKVWYSPFIADPNNLSAIVIGKNMTECNDGVDNDGDGLIDWDGLGDPAKADPNCIDASWWNESVEPPPRNITVDQPVNMTDGPGNETGNETANETADCSYAYICTDWSDCQPDGLMIRTCFKNQECEGSPAEEVKTCIYTDPCSNGVLDPGEEMIDCGGPCGPCIAPVEESPAGFDIGSMLFYIIGGILILMLLGGGAYGYLWYEKDVMNKKAMMEYEKEKTLNSYIQDELADGYSVDQITKKMTSSGWDPDMVRKVIGRNNTIIFLKPYIEDLLRKGYSQDKITETLTLKGWDRRLVERMMNTVDSRSVTAKVPDYLVSQAWKNHYSNMNLAIQSKFSGTPNRPLASQSFAIRPPQAGPKMTPQKPVQQLPPSGPYIRPGAYAKKQSRIDKPVKKEGYQLVQEEGRWVIRSG